MKALGMIETKGMIATVEAADSMLKAADVQLVSSIKVGAGLVTAVVEGDVGAVKAAVDAGVAAVRAINPKALKSEHVIPRPDDSVRIVLTRGGGRKHASGPHSPNPDPSPDNGGGAPDTGTEASEVISVENRSENVVDSEVETVTPDQTENTVMETSDGSEQEKPETEVKAEEEPKVEAEPEAEAETELKVEAEPEIEVETESEVDEEEEPEVEAKAETEAEPDEEKKAELPQIKDRESIDQVVAEAGIDALDTALEGLRVSELRKLARGYSGFSLTGRDISKANKQMLIEAFKGYYK